MVDEGSGEHTSVFLKHQSDTGFAEICNLAISFDWKLKDLYLGEFMHS